MTSSMAEAQRGKAETLKALHRRGNPVILFNVWDAVSARIVEELGFPAIATTSAGIAFLEGFADGQRISRDRMLAGVERVTRVVHVPVTADLEAGYGDTPEDAAETARGAIDAGAVGLNFEDALDERELYGLAAQCARIGAMRNAAAKIGVPLVINARTDVFLGGIGESDAWRLEESVRRCNAYLRAGADCAFVPGVTDEHTIAKLAASIEGPLNVLAGAASPSVAKLAQAGVARISVGSAPIGYVMAKFRDAARSVKDTGSFAFATERIPHGETNKLFA